MGFNSLPLDERLVKALNDLAYLNPTLIQQQAIPLILAKHDVMARAQTGTGKTAAFALPIVNNLLKEVNPSSRLQALVLVPTRELAKQVHQSFLKYSQYTDIKVGLAYGGVSVKSQSTTLQAGVDVLISTPGRLLDHLTRESIELNLLKVLVFDEADRMLDLGFKDEINRILNAVPKKVQTLLFSATFDDEIYKISKRLQSDPKIVEIDDKNSVAESVEQTIYTVDKDKKAELTSFLIGSKNWQQVLIFTRTKQGADDLAKEMNKDGIKTLAIHGDKSQGAREKSLKQFKQGDIRALVATDVAARGIDIPSLKYVINYELPYKAEDYIHRIGRTARAGKSGQAVSLLCTNEEWLLIAIEKVLEEKLVQQWYPGYEPNLEGPEKNSPFHDRGTKNKKQARKEALGTNEASKKKNRKRRRR